MKIYLAGPMFETSDSEAKNWREAFKRFFGEKKCLDPMRRDYRGDLDANINEIICMDKRDIQMSDVVVVNCLRPSVGTSMEMYYAWTLGIPIVAILHPPRVRASPWL